MEQRERVPGVRFRHNAGATVAAGLSLAGAVPLAFTLWYPLLVPLLVVPLAVAVWAWRAGTDAGPAGLRVRALLGSRQLAWADIEGFAPAGRRVVALVRDGGAVPLPALRPGDLPRLLDAAPAVAPEPQPEADRSTR